MELQCDDDGVHGIIGQTQIIGITGQTFDVCESTVGQSAFNGSGGALAPLAGQRSG